MLVIYGLLVYDDGDDDVSQVEIIEQKIDVARVI